MQDGDIYLKRHLKSKKVDYTKSLTDIEAKIINSGRMKEMKWNKNLDSGRKCLL